MKLAALTVSLTFALGMTAFSANAETPYLPKSAPPAAAITTLDLSPATALLGAPNSIANVPASVPQISDLDVKLLMVSLQGIVNSSQPRIYVLNNADPNHATSYLHDYYKQLGTFSTETVVRCDYNLLVGTGPGNGILYAFKNDILGLVIVPVNANAVGTADRFDYRLNVATNVAGVEKRLIVPESLKTFVRRVLPDIPDKDVLDLTQSGGIAEMQDPHAAEQWSLARSLSGQSSAALANLYWDETNLFSRDYVIAHAIHTFWWPGSVGEVAAQAPNAQAQTVYQDLTDLLRTDVMFASPSNIPVLGSWEVYLKPQILGCPLEPTGTSRKCGLTEYTGVKRAGEYGKFTMALGYDANNSFHSGVQVRPNDIAIRQYRARARAYQPYNSNPGKTYVALTMVDSGDSPNYLQYGLRTLQWGDPYRGRVPISWALSVSARDLNPGLIQYLYETATANDYFFASLSGLGYMYPLPNSYDIEISEDTVANGAPYCGYGGRLSSGPPCPYLPEPQKSNGVMSDYAARLNGRMGDMDLDAMAIYSVNRYAAPHGQSTATWTNGISYEAFIQEQLLPGLLHLTAIAADWARPPDPLPGVPADVSNPAIANFLLYNPAVDPARGGGTTTGIHHALTNASGSTLSGCDSYSCGSWGDDTAVNSLVSEISSQRAAGNRFIHAPGVSWMYGPRRFYKVMQALLAQDSSYVFVTLDELDAHWRMSANAAYSPNRDPWGHLVNLPWCSHPGSVLLRGDVNGDGSVDSICHDSAGNWWTSGTNLTGSELSSLTGWCTGDANRLYAGEWTGDGVVDFLCYAPEDLAWSATGPHPRTMQESNGTGVYAQRTILKNYFCTDPYQPQPGADLYRWLEPARESQPPGQLACYSHWGPNGATLASPGSLVDTGFGPPETWSSFGCDATQDCHLADVTGDHRDDLVAFSTNGSVYVSRSNGTSFEAPQQKLSQFCIPGLLPSSNVCEVGDVDGDGRADLVAFLHGTGVNTAAVWVAFSTGTGFLPPIKLSSFFCTAGQRCRVADIDGLGRADLVAFTNDSSALVWASLSQGRTLKAPQLWHSFFCTTGQDCDLGDVDGDGRADLIAFGHPQVWVSLSSKTGAGTAAIWSNFFCLTGQVCRVADVDHDQKVDLLAFTHDAAPVVWVGASAGYTPLGGFPLGPNHFFLEPVLWSPSFCGSGERCLVGDVTGDGAADAVSLGASPTNTIHVARALH